MNDPFRILVIDDDADFRLGIRMLLKDEPCEVYDAPDGAEGLRVARERKPELVLCDVIMPGMEGTQVVKELKSDPSLSDTYIILISGVKTGSEEQAQGLETGADGYITRPISRRELLARIRVFIRLKKAEQALEESERKYRMLYDTMIIGYAIHEMVLDEMGNPCDYRFLEVNPEFEKLTGLHAKDIVGKKVTEIIPHIEFEWIEKYGRVALEGKEIRFVEYTEAIGRYFEVYAFSTEYGKFSTLFYDVTQRVKSEERMKHYNQELQSLNASKDRFFSIIAHDLRGPVASFQGLTELLDESFEEMKPSEVLDIIRSMKKTTRNLAGLIDNLLHWARLQKGSLVANPMEVSIMEAVPSCLDIMIPVAEKKDIKIETFLPSGLRLRTDPDILKTVLRNLLSNAIKFTPPGGHIKLIGMKLPGNYAKVSVSDTGIGMDAVTLDNLFSLEGLSNRPGTEGEPSSGLGLLLCRDLLKLQNIEMEIVSTAGRGTEISFELPTA